MGDNCFGLSHLIAMLLLKDMIQLSQTILHLKSSEAWEMLAEKVL